MFCLLTAAALLLVIDCGVASPQQAAIKLDPNRKYQKMTGWEATAQAGENNSPAFAKYRDQLFDRAVNDLGINRLRLEIKSGTENPVDYFTQWQSGRITEKEFNGKRYEVINDNDDPRLIDPKGFQFSEIDSKMEKIVLPMKKLLERRGEDLYLNLNFVDFRRAPGNSNIRHNDDPEEYAELILAAYSHLEDKYGFVPDAVEVVLEPDNRTGWTGTDIGKAITATARRLEEKKFKPAFIVPGTTNAANTAVYIDQIAGVPGAMKHISEFSYHRYCCASEKVLEKIAQRAERYGKQTAMLEWIGADYKTLHQDLKTGRNSSWQQYTLAFPNQPDNGAQYFLIDDKDPNRPMVTAGSRTRFLRQYFRYIRSGAQRIGAETSNPGFDPLAFINADGRHVLVVKADVPGTIEVEGLPADIYGISYTTAKETDVQLPDSRIKKGGILKATIPDSGVMTIFAKSDAK